MNGTKSSARAVIRRCPPMTTTATTAAKTIPITHEGMLNALVKAIEMELACTILPTKPKARTMAIEKKTASHLLPRP